MKRAAILVVVLFAAAAMAQVNGVPASVTSQTSKSYTPGVPASVTSLGPHGWQGGSHHGGKGGSQSGWQGGSQFGTPPALPPTTFSCFGGGIICAPTTFPPVDTGFHGRHHHGGHGYGGYGYAYAPYYYSGYPVYSTDSYSTMGAGYDYLQPGSAVTVEDADPPAPTIYERRPATRPYARDEARYDDDHRAPAAQQAPRSSTIGVGEQDPTTLVFADGHQMDVHNYAIVGQTLFNFDGTGPFKVKLTELNLGATEKINDDHGVEFKLPQ